MKKVLRVLHVASFAGNIGDNANHQGAARLRDQFLDFTFKITEKEIRESYWKDWSFNSSKFIAEANTYDLVIFGGGNYFELGVNKSLTGTTVDLGVKTLKKIKTPILFYALGCDLQKGAASTENVEKFKSFLDYVTIDNNYYVSVRKDWSLKNIEELYGDRYANKIAEIPDGGFFMDAPKLANFELEKNKKNIVINLAGDMAEVRFPEQKNKLSFEAFKTGFAKLIEELDTEYDQKINFIFVPHIFRDLKVIHDVIDQVSDRVRRRRIKVAPYLIGDKGRDYIFSLYKQADLIVGMRYHTNVCSFALKQNIIGLFTSHKEIKELHETLGSREFVEINDKNFKRDLKKMIREHLSNPKKYRLESAAIITKLKNQAKHEYRKLNTWLTHF